MANYGVDIYDFEHWTGDAPQFAQPEIRSHTRPGTWGTYQQNLGVKGEPFEVELKHIFASYLAAQQALAQWNTLVGQGPLQIKYEGVNYLGAYAHLYSVDKITRRHAYALNGAIGPTYFYPTGGAAIIGVVLTPHPVNV